MSEWQECQLGEIAEIQTGPFGSQLKNEQYITGGTPIVTVEHISNFRINNFSYPSVTDEDKNRLSRYLLNEGDIIFTRVGSVDLSAFVKPHQQGWMFSSRMLRVRPETKIDARFLSYFFQQKPFRDYVLSIAVGATMPSINTEILKSIPISYPELSVQKAIAAVLSSLDDKIDLLHRQNKTLETMADTLFRQGFVKEAGDWEEGTLGDVVELVYGKALKEDLRTGSGYPVVGSNGIVGHHAEYLVEGPGIVIGRKGTLGKVTYLFRSFFPIDTTYYIKSKDNSLGMLYEYFLLKTLNFENSDSAVPGLNRDIALSEEIKIPPKNIITEFNDICASFFSKIMVNTNQIQTLQTLRDALLPKLMSGEVRVDYV
ncbi:MAG: restriction endonuclease subunit S [Nitrosomonas sp.]|nr:restriction endonuclease subunit S [Nitrosomonas sp.]